jgi:hypothetical protein
MTTSVRPQDVGFPPHRVAGASAAPSAARMRSLAPLHFALNFATALPPDALVFPPGAGWPEIRPAVRAIVSAADIATVLGRPTQVIGRGRVRLADLDERLVGLVVEIKAFQVVEQHGALIALGIAESAPSPNVGTTTDDLWTWAREALVRQSIPWEPLHGIGHDAFLAAYPPTALVAWLAGECLLTASVTSLVGDQDRRSWAARSIATLVDDRLLVSL